MGEGEGMRQKLVILTFPSDSVSSWRVFEMTEPRVCSVRELTRGRCGEFVMDSRSVVV